MTMYVNEYNAAADDDGMRLDAFLAAQLTEVLSRTKIKDWIKAGHVTVNGEVVVNAHAEVRDGDEIEIRYRVASEAVPEPEKMPLDIRYEDDDVVVVNKPAGLVVHPGAGCKAHTLVNGLVAHFNELSKAGGSIRPGIVHRIDKDTSGLLVIAKNDTAHMKLAEQFKEHSNVRRYYAVVKGVVQYDQGRCDAAIGQGKLFKKKMIVEAADGRHAVTFYKVVERYPQATLIELTLETGRTHQIRVHMAYLGHPVIGDQVYGVSSRFIKRQALHAWLLGFKHPRTGKYIECKADLPDDMQSLVEHLRKTEEE